VCLVTALPSASPPLSTQPPAATYSFSSYALARNDAVMHYWLSHSIDSITLLPDEALTIAVQDGHILPFVCKAFRSVLLDLRHMRLWGMVAPLSCISQHVMPDANDWPALKKWLQLRGSAIRTLHIRRVQTHTFHAQQTCSPAAQSRIGQACGLRHVNMHPVGLVPQASMPHLGQPPFSSACFF
jgi:hypothetical protein